MHQDESREIHAIAYVPLLLEKFEGRFNSEAFQIDLPKLSARFDGLKGAVEYSEKLQQEFPVSDVEEALGTIRRLSTLEGIAVEIQRAEQGEREAVYRAYRGVLELAGAMNQVRKTQTGARIERQIGQLQRVVQDEEAQDLERIGQELVDHLRSAASLPPSVLSARALGESSTPFSNDAHAIAP